MNNFKIVSGEELENLYHAARTALGPNGIGRKISFLSLCGNSGYTQSICQVVSYRPSKDPSFFLTLAFPSGGNFIILEDVEVVALLPDLKEGEEADDEMPMVGVCENVTKLVAIVNRDAERRNMVATNRASFRLV